MRSVASETTDSEWRVSKPASWRALVFVRIVGWILAAGVIAVVAIDLALLIVPSQPVHVLGQTIRVGAARPSLDLAGPGHVVLFSQTLDVMPGVDFPGPIRPSATLTKLSTNTYLGQLTDGDHPGAVQAAAAAASHALVEGWLHYFAWVAAAAALFAGVLGVLLHRGLTRHRLGGNLSYGCLALVVAVLMVAGNVALDAHIGRQTFTDPHLADRFFDHSSVELPPPARGQDTTTQVAVLGDSTQSGEGLRSSGRANSPDRLCRRSVDAAAAKLRVTGLAVTNLACSGATIPDGIMGGQVRAGRTISPQLSALESMPDVKFIIVGIGADDLRWSSILKACIGLQACDNEAVTATFEDYLQQFVQSYSRLLVSLQNITMKLNHRVVVVIDQYYDPFGSASGCSGLRRVGWPGLTAAKVTFLSGLLDQLNATIASGAKAAGFLTTKPDFGGNQVCDREPYVQDLGDRAPFHPNALGQLKIAMTNLATFPSNWRAVAAGIPKKPTKPKPAPTPSTSVHPKGTATPLTSTQN